MTRERLCGKIIKNNVLIIVVPSVMLGLTKNYDKRIYSFLLQKSVK